MRKSSEKKSWKLFKKKLTLMKPMKPKFKLNKNGKPRKMKAQSLVLKQLNSNSKKIKSSEKKKLRLEKR